MPVEFTKKAGFNYYLLSMGALNPNPKGIMEAQKVFLSDGGTSIYLETTETLNSENFGAELPKYWEAENRYNQSSIDENLTLALPENVKVVTPTIEDLTKVTKNTKITLEVTIPNGKELDTFKVNNLDKTLENNQFTFAITENTTVTVTFKDKSSTPDKPIEGEIQNSLGKVIKTKGEGITGSFNEDESALTIKITVPEGKTIRSVTLNSNNITDQLNENNTLTINASNIPENATFTVYYNTASNNKKLVPAIVIPIVLVLIGVGVGLTVFFVLRSKKKKNQPKQE